MFHQKKYGLDKSYFAVIVSSTVFICVCFLCLYVVCAIGFISDLFQCVFDNGVISDVIFVLVIILVASIILFYSSHDCQQLILSLFILSVA